MTTLFCLFLLTASLFLGPVLSWNLPFRRNKTVTTASKSTDSRLFYKDLDTESLFESSLIVPELSVATPIPHSIREITVMEYPQSPQQPRAMDLPRHSPPKVVLKRQKMMLDAELAVGRMAMVTALVLFINECFTGNSMVEQMMSLFR